MKEFEEGLIRSIRQYRSGEVESFEELDEFIRSHQE